MSKITYAANASKLHKLVGELLSNSTTFGGYELCQEYPASKVNPKLSDRFHYDWAIPQLKLIIECHGKQHYEPATFGGVDYEVAISNFHDTQSRDRIKKEYALYNGWSYIEIKYDMNITEELLFNLYCDAMKESMTYDGLVMDDNREDTENEYKKEQKAKAAEYRRKRYREQKEWIKQHKK